MPANFEVDQHTVHVWRVSLDDLQSQESELVTLLSPDELERANRFHFPQHSQRFIIARGVLRSILSLYTGLPPQNHDFEYGKRGKPFLKNNLLNLQFNVSHSDDVAVYAITKEFEIGVDIEKIKNEYKEGIAQRFFSESENLALAQLPHDEQIMGFYQIWACKEALIKAAGEGLYVPLGDFSISLEVKSQSVILNHEHVTKQYYVENFTAFPGYSSAVATTAPVKKISWWKWPRD